MESTIILRRSRAGIGLAALLGMALAALAAPGQAPGESAVIQSIDRAVMARIDGIAGYTVTEHYAVFRNQDENHPVAEMTVRTTYRKATGKSYAILSESGSSVIRKFVLNTILENEKRINEPGIREGSWIVSANYEMKLKQAATVRIDGRDCYVLSITPNRKAPYLLEGTIWVDAGDGNIVRIEGESSKSPSVFTGPTQMSRQYTNIDGFAEATHARAESNSSLFGKTVVKIDYSGYRIELAQSR